MTDKMIIEQERINTDAFLPYGEMLRSMLASSFLTPTDIKKTLNKRGVFVRHAEKDDTIPILMTCLLSPQEFERLCEKQRTKEDKPKHRTRTIHVERDDFRLLDVVKDRKVAQDLIPKHANYRVLGNPSFRTSGDPDELVLEYTLERTNRTKDWSNLKSTHPASIRLKKEGNCIKVTSEHTANETENLNERVMRKVVAQLKDGGFVHDDKQVKRITFSDFTNEGRVAFLISMTNGDEKGFLSFQQVINIGMGPDSEQPLPSLLNWMENKVKALELRGQQLHEARLIQDTENHKSLIVETIEAVYEFDFRGASGTCTLQFGFPNYLKTSENTTEFEVNIDKISWVENKTYSKKETERFILRTFDAMKDKMYGVYCKKWS